VDIDKDKSNKYYWGKIIDDDDFSWLREENINYMISKINSPAELALFVNHSAEAMRNMLRSLRILKEFKERIKKLEEDQERILKFLELR